MIKKSVHNNFVIKFFESGVICPTSSAEYIFNRNPIIFCSRTRGCSCTMRFEYFHMLLLLFLPLTTHRVGLWGGVQGVEEEEGAEM